MGNYISAHKMYCDDNKNKTICFICSENIKEKQFTVCVRCNIGIHNICEELYRTNKYYTICPHCERCGSLATKISK